MTWHVLGAGSLGLLWAARMANAGLDVRLILRNEVRVSDFRAAGGILFSSNEAQQLLALPAQTAGNPEPITRLILACKAYDAEAAIASVNSRLADNASVLLLQNGLGSQSAVATQIPHARCILLSSTEGAFRSESFSVNFAGRGNNWLGDPLNPTPPEWLHELQLADIPYQWTSAINTRQWRKLAVNCAINPLCVLHNCLNGGLLEHQHEVAAICRELEELLETNAGKEAAEALSEEVQQVIVATARNQCSMLQDVQRRQRTEITYLLGFACTQALQAGLHLPQLSNLHTKLRNHLQSLGLPAD